MQIAATIKVHGLASVVGAAVGIASVSHGVLGCIQGFFIEVSVHEQGGAIQGHSLAQGGLAFGCAKLSGLQDRAIVRCQGALQIPHFCLDGVVNDIHCTIGGQYACTSVDVDFTFSRIQLTGERNLVATQGQAVCVNSCQTR